MFDSIMLTISQYWNYYCQFFVLQWHQTTPTKYATLLIGISAVGWLMMKGGGRKR